MHIIILQNFLMAYFPTLMEKEKQEIIITVDTVDIIDTQ